MQTQPQSINQTLPVFEVLGKLYCDICGKRVVNDKEWFEQHRKEHDNENI